MSNYCLGSERYYDRSIERFLKRCHSKQHYSVDSVLPQRAVSSNATPTVNIYTSTIPVSCKKELSEYSEALKMVVLAAPKKGVLSCHKREMFPQFFDTLKEEFLHTIKRGVFGVLKKRGSPEFFGSLKEEFWQSLKKGVFPLPKRERGPEFLESLKRGRLGFKTRGAKWNHS